jgi:outer membrane protein assembly factor BamE
MAIMVQKRSLAPVSRSASSVRSRALLTLILAVPLLGGCVYRMAIQQGNFLDARQVAQLEVGMTRSQVRFLLGTPMLPDAFNRDRWDYLYTLDLGRGDGVERQRLTVFFEGDTVARIENDGVPTQTDAATESS